jgi:hypothetical protein
LHSFKITCIDVFAKSVLLIAIIDCDFVFTVLNAKWESVIKCFDTELVGWLINKIDYLANIEQKELNKIGLAGHNLQGYILENVIVLINKIFLLIF